MLNESKAADAVVAAYQAVAVPAVPALPGGDAEAFASAKADVEAGLAGAASEGGAEEAGASEEAAAAMEAERPRVPFAFQTGVLSVRMLRNWGRNPMMLAAEGVQVRLGWVQKPCGNILLCAGFRLHMMSEWQTACR